VLNLDAANPKSYPGSGTTWTDLSVGKKNATLVGGIVYNTNNNGVMTFDGVDDRVDVAGSVLAKTIIAWIKLSTAAGGDYIVYGLDANGSDNWFGVNANKVVFHGTEFADINNFTFSGTTTLNTTNYYQIAATIAGDTATIYLNGQQENTTTRAFTIAAWNTAPTIGRRGSISQRWFPGDIACVQVYDTVLSPNEIRQNFNATRGRFAV
jgi:hypothetical protein